MARVDIFLLKQKAYIMAGVVATDAEIKKLQKYGSITQDHIFLPFGVESMGPWGKEAKLFIKHLSKRLLDSTNDPRAGAYLGQRISLAIQRGNVASILGTHSMDSNLDAAYYILVLSTTCLHSFNNGIIHAFPSVLNPAILSSNTTDIKASPDDASWIAASFGLSGILGFVILSPMFQILGRKPVILLLNVSIFIGWIILYFANSVIALIIGRLVQGLALGGVYMLGITLGEYSHKKRRGYFMAIKKVSLASGSLTCHSLGLVTSWRQLVVIGAAVITLSTILLLPCPESPAFLAMRGKFEECKKSFYWLFGISAESTKELRELIIAQMKSIEQKKTEKKQFILLQTIHKILQRDFLKPFFIVVFATLALDACGRYFLLAYITQIMVEITDNPSISMYCSSVADILLIIALCISCVVVKLYNRRTITFRLGSVLVLLMFLVSLSSLVGSQYKVSGMKWITASSILLNSFISHVGFVPVMFTLNAEIFPLELRGLGSLASGIIFSAFYSLTMKLTPVMIDETGIGGTFAIYGSCVLVCLFVLYFILPETKDKTLQEIENEIKGTAVVTDITEVELNLIEFDRSVK